MNSTSNDTIKPMKDMKRQYANIYKWKKNNVKRVEFYISNDKKELLDWFNSQPSKQALILELLEKEFKKRGKKV